MAMNKTERAEMEALRNELAPAKAWRRTEPVEKDVPPPDCYDELRTGWVFFGGQFEPRVDVVCSSSIYHATGRIDNTNCQSPIRMYSTRLMALKAARYSFECAAAKKLAALDKEIEDEVANPRNLESV